MGVNPTTGELIFAGHAIDYTPGERPPAGLVKWARAQAGLTQAQAAAVVWRAAPSRWAEWEAGTYAMDPAVFELFCRKVGLADALFDAD